ncbi:MAG: hypothetical protein AAGL49_07770, partial [Pseudomonadota bacterium]
PSPAICLAFFAVTKFCWAATITVGFTAIAQITPNTVRGLMVSVFMALMNVTGGAFGAVAVGVLSDQVFGPENVRYALSLVAGVTIPLAALLFFAVRKTYRRRLAELAAS